MKSYVHAWKDVADLVKFMWSLGLKLYICAFFGIKSQFYYKNFTQFIEFLHVDFPQIFKIVVWPWNILYKGTQVQVSWFWPQKLVRAKHWVWFRAWGFDFQHSRFFSWFPFILIFTLFCGFSVLFAYTGSPSY